MYLPNDDDAEKTYRSSNGKSLLAFNNLPSYPTRSSPNTKLNLSKFLMNSRD